MLPRSWLIIVTCALIVSPALFALDVISGAVAWLLFLGFAALIVVTLVFGEQTRRRAGKAPAGLLQDGNAEDAGILRTGESAQRSKISPSAR